MERDSVTFFSVFFALFGFNSHSLPIAIGINHSPPDSYRDCFFNVWFTSLSLLILVSNFFCQNATLLLGAYHKLAHPDAIGMPCIPAVFMAVKTSSILMIF